MKRNQAAEIIENMIDGQIFSKREALKAALKALKLPELAEIETAFMGNWEGEADGYSDGELVFDIWRCSGCGHTIDEQDDPELLPDFCPVCGSANTDKARDILRKRLEQMQNGEDQPEKQASCFGCAYQEEEYAPCSHCVRARRDGDYYRRALRAD